MRKKITTKTRFGAAVGFAFLTVACMYAYFSGIDKSTITLVSAAGCLAVSIYELKRISDIKKTESTKNK
ncbi:hypothetical protein [Peptoclostridium sp. AF21-18]|uniref:hypothetical protein n=1 Tax=Peptoclostridium sp. AF21-18 TaxID=2292243 RepID=UPI000E4CDA52|nr:hypothetical protein [Peptoclostridium sp. AF21-18]RHQ99714.1 hypothetical protein DWX74_00485 [Peptoclostridium sp. AF21-18]